MTEPVSLKDIVDHIIKAQPQMQGFRPILEKEVLHYDILSALSHEGLLDGLVFQGGTSLRLCYGGLRYSEDLDFAGDRDFVSTEVLAIKEAVEDYIGKRYNLAVAVKYPKEMRQQPDYENVQVDKWQVSIETQPGRRDLPRQKIKLEIANIPAYTPEFRFLQINYPGLPEHYEDLALQVESLPEIMSDKIVSLCASTKVVRYRDIWDLSWLAKKGHRPLPELVEKKIHDYKIQGFEQLLQQRLENLPALLPCFTQEMQRFLPQNELSKWENPTFQAATLHQITDLLDSSVKS